jgi:thiamine-phosphate pyrophosphorylase
MPAPMRRTSERSVLRLMDANLNRLKEGLRVCEDTARFVLDDRRAARELKSVRHEIASCVTALGCKELALAREVRTDVGAQDRKSEYLRKDINDVFFANAQRCKESIRVLEEYAKLFDKTIARKMKRARYAFYTIEKRIIKKI